MAVEVEFTGGFGVDHLGPGLGAEGAVLLFAGEELVDGGAFEDFGDVGVPAGVEFAEGAGNGAGVGHASGELVRGIA